MHFEKKNSTNDYPLLLFLSSFDSNVEILYIWHSCQFEFEVYSILFRTWFVYKKKRLIEECEYKIIK